jgi:hypothetical protein
MVEKANHWVAKGPEVCLLNPKLWVLLVLVYAEGEESLAAAAIIGVVAL